MNDSAEIEIRAYPWKLLYLVGGAAALIAVIFFRRNISAELSLLQGSEIFSVPATLPNNALDWFALLQKHPFVGLALLDFFDLINYALVGLIFLALHAALKIYNRSLILIATASGLVGVAVYLASNKSLEMLSLSKQFSAAASDHQRAILVFAGDVILATHPHNPAYQPVGDHIGLFLVLLAGLLISMVMLRSGVFSKTTAVCGLLANGIALAGFIFLAAAPEIYWLFPTVSAPFRMIWYVLIAIKLLKRTRLPTLQQEFS